MDTVFYCVSGREAGDGIGVIRKPRICLMWIEAVSKNLLTAEPAKYAQRTQSKNKDIKFFANFATNLSDLCDKP